LDTYCGGGIRFYLLGVGKKGEKDNQYQIGCPHGRVWEFTLMYLSKVTIK
jgi:hypothetical protein